MSRRALLALLAAGVAACSHPEPGPKMAPVYRFADASWRAKAQTNLATQTVAVSDGVHTLDYPVVSLADEARYTLSQNVRAQLFYTLSHPTGPGNTLHLYFPVPETFRMGDRVALETESTLEAVRKHYPAVLATVQTVYGVRGIEFDLPIPDEYVGLSLGVKVKGTVVPKDRDLWHRTAAVRVPQHAILDFAFGIEEAAWLEGPVEFRVRACAGTECETVFQELVDPSIPSERGWNAAEVDLEPWAGREVSFSFESTLVSSKSSAFSLPVWANPTVYAPANNDARANVILISLDTLSAKHLPTYGYEFPTAPFLDGVLAREGLVFERAVAASTTTPQSHMSMFTSVQPCRHGVLTGMEYLHPDLVTLAEVLRAAGYETGAVTEDGWLAYEPGYGHGFNVYAENKSPNVMAPEGQFGATLARARSWLDHNGNKPFFLFLHTFQVHDPYVPPKKYGSLFRKRDGVEVDEASPRPLRDVVAYDQEIRYVDDLLESFFAFLGERQLLDDTVIIVTSDHGEEFFEHGEWGHGRNLFEEVTRVPLILWGRGRIPIGRRAETVGHVDLMPTILALAGVAVPGQATGRNILAPAASSRRVTESRVDVAFGPDYERLAVLPPSFMVQEGSRKLSRYRDPDGYHYEAYALDSDPQEKNNLVPNEAAAFEAMTKLLDGYEASCVEGARATEPAAPMPLEEQRKEKLRALGYLE